MQYIGPFGMDEFAAGNASERLRLIAKVLKEYQAAGKTSQQFEEDFGCNIIMDRSCIGIEDIKFHNSSNETMFMLKYNK